MVNEWLPLLVRSDNGKDLATTAGVIPPWLITGYYRWRGPTMANKQRLNRRWCGPTMANKWFPPKVRFNHGK